MAQIRPISDLRNKFTEISLIVHEQKEPIYLTKNGYGDMVVMSIEQFEQMNTERINFALSKAEKESVNNTKISDFDTVALNLREKLKSKIDK